MANLNVRIDENLKNDVDRILRRLGLSVSDAVRIFFTRVCEERYRGLSQDLKADFIKPGSELLSHDLRHSIIAAEDFRFLIEKLIPR